MRPLCGAIITAGALIGLGLFAMGYGTRYAAYAERNASWELREDYWVKFHQMDTTLIVAFVMLTAILLIGLAITFVGLAYHHHKRHHQMLRALAHPEQQNSPGPRPV